MGRHGHRVNYLRGCRFCTQTTRVITQRLRARRYAERVPVNGRLISPTSPGHGTPNSYNNYGCRCRECTDVWKLAMRERRARRRAATRGNVED